MELLTDGARAQYALEQIRRLIPEHPLLSKIEVYIWNHPNAQFMMFHDPQAGTKQLNIPAKSFNNLSLLTLSIAHELGHLDQIIRIDLFAHLASKWAESHPKISRALGLLSLYFQNLSGESARFEAEADMNAIGMLKKIGVTPRQYLAVMEEIQSDIRRIKSPYRRFAKQFSFNQRLKKVKKAS